VGVVPVISNRMNGDRKGRPTHHRSPVEFVAWMPEWVYGPNSSAGRRILQLAILSNL